MSKRTTKVALYLRHPDKFIKLCQAVVEHNTALGAASPFATGDFVDMAAFAQTLTKASSARQKALELYAEAEAAMYESRQLMGFNKGQTATTAGTLYNQLCLIKKLLLVLETENPEALSVWGFDVTVKTAKARGKKKAGTV